MVNWCKEDIGEDLGMGRMKAMGTKLLFEELSCSCLYIYIYIYIYIVAGETI